MGAKEAKARIKINTLREGFLPGWQILESLSFTHLVELIQIEDPDKRAFYEAAGQLNTYVT